MQLEVQAIMNEIGRVDLKSAYTKCGQMKHKIVN